MFGIYPVRIDGVETGTLQVRSEGIMTVFEAQCDDPGEILRLSVYGEKEGYLGVMLPNGTGKLCLCKKLSRAALKDFPEEIRFAAQAGQAPVSQKDTSDAKAQPHPEAVEQNTEPETLWRLGAGGALIGFREGMRWLAVPLKEGVAPGEGDFEIRNIDGADYAVFEIKNGKII